MVMRDAKGVEWHVRVGEMRQAQSLPPITASPDSEMHDETWRRYVDSLSKLDDSRPIRRTSQDGNYHLCIWANRVHCVYFPAGG